MFLKLSASATKWRKNVAIAGLMLFLAACGSSSSTGGYNVEFVQGSTLTNGKSQFQLKVTKKSDGSAATGIASKIQLGALMHMTTMNHSTPIPADAVSENSTPGTYDCTIYFLMASVDSSGMSMGTWDVTVTIDNETTTFNPAVAMAMGDTKRVVLKSNSDMVAGMDGSMSARWYSVFNDGLVAGETHGSAFTVFIAAQEEGLMSFPAIATGTQLKNISGAVELTVDTLLVEISADGAEWDAMTCDANGRCEGHMHAYASGEQATAYIRMTINGVQYTTDGNAASGSTDVATSNSFATFKATMGGSSMSSGGM